MKKRKILIQNQWWDVKIRQIELYPKNARAKKIESSIDFEVLAKRLAGVN